MRVFMRKFTALIMSLLLSCLSAMSEEIEVTFDYSSVCQTIHSFGASDCWRTRFLGENWPLEKREAIADLLFSTELDSSGNPKGIGLSLWRFNIGSGSADSESGGGITSIWRRTECFLDSSGSWDWTKQSGQRWMMEAARRRGVPYILGFSISAPYFMSKNGLARASEDNEFANIREDAYDDYAAFLAEVSTKLGFDYISPINEPQWQWIRSNQEGMQATNAECKRLVRCLDAELRKRSSGTKIVFGEAGDIRYLYRDGTDKPGRDNQIKDIFAKSADMSIDGLTTVEKIVSGHSYWSTWPIDTLLFTRISLRQEMENVLPGYSYWQTEYCPMERNRDNPGGGGRDTSMDMALYIARIIHNDLVVANASSWQSWTAFSEADYKDALIYIMPDQESGAVDCREDGKFLETRYLWVLGNYSFFIRPGMVRIASDREEYEMLKSDAEALMCSGYYDSNTGKTVIVAINYGEEPCQLHLDFKNGRQNSKSSKFNMYITSGTATLDYVGKTTRKTSIPPRSVVTLVSYR